MQFDLEPNTGIFIRSFSAGELRVNEQVITGSVILTRDKIILDWSPPAIDDLSLTDFHAALATGPDVILLGTGTAQIFPPTSLATDIMRQGVGFEAMGTAAACRTFNVLASEGRRVAAALIL